MVHRRSRRYWPAGLILACALSRGWSAEPTGPDLENLLQHSPFGVSADHKTGAGPGLPLEFRGVLVDRGEMLFSIFEAASHSASWVGLEESGSPFVVQRYDEATGLLIVEYQGRTLRLQLAEAKIRVLALAGPLPTTLPTIRSTAVEPPTGDQAAQAERVNSLMLELRRKLQARKQSQLPGSKND